MASPFLLVQTPRAGSKNHRFLVSEGAGLDESAASARLQEALRRADDAGVAHGRNFLAVCCRGVLQTTGDRAGDEVLLLGGVDPAAMSCEERREIVARLWQRMETLGQLVAGIDWDRAAGLLSEEKALSSWLSKEFATAPGVAPPRRAWRRILTVAIVAAIGLAATTAGAPPLLDLIRRPEKPEAAPSTQASRSRTPRQLFAQFLKTNGVPHENEEKARAELIALLYGAGERPEGVKSLDDNRILGFLQEAADKTKVNPYRFATGKAGRLREQFPLGEQVDPGKAVKLRKCLAAVARCAGDYRRRAGELRMPELDPKQYPFLKTAHRLAVIKADIPMTEPVLPYFRAEDDAIVTGVMEWLRDGVTEGVAKKIGFQGNGTFLEMLEGFQKNDCIMLEGLGAEDGNVRAKTPRAGVAFNEGEKKVIRELKEAFEAFIESLTKIELPPSSTPVRP